MLWKRNRTRYFAQLDASGRCQAFWMLRKAPATGNWIEVSDADPRWIGHHLHVPGASSASSRPAGR